MELLLQFIMGGGSIVGQSEAQHHSCSSKGGAQRGGWECRVGSTTFLCAPTPDTAASRRSPSARNPSRDGDQGTPHDPSPGVPQQPGSGLLENEGKQGLCHHSLAGDHRIFPAVLASGFWTEPRFGLAGNSPWHLDGPKRSFLVFFLNTRLA